ncbi:hypothetical protein H0H87_006291 [Tephrocybe sp. NHM501043]|nr:hypothetical protein H0H87_006291 [Tephrocybe sp. NHM501043]
MGQSSSRQRAASSSSPATTPTTTTTTHDESEQPTTPRRSVRKTLLNLVKPSASSSVPRKKRSWRSSRRLSKTPEASSSEHGEDQEAQVGGEAEAEADTDADAEHPVVDSEDSEHQAPSSSAAASVDAPPTDVDTSPTSTHTIDAPLPAPPPENEATEAAPPAPGQQTHAFPPPGTLVVVQGVVHTTDVPRQSRLSALVNNATAEAVEAESAPEREASRAAMPLPATTAPTPTARAATGTPLTPGQPAAAADGHGHGGISSGSIDVLGTLLSVAAAATAASLLTGTSEPIQLPTSIPAPTASTPTPTEPLRPSSPTPTSGLDPTRLRQAWGGFRERLGLRSAPPSAPPDHDLANGPFTPEAHEPPNDPREHLFGQMARAFNLGLGLTTDQPASPRSATANANDTGAASESSAEGAPASASTEGPEEPVEGSFERFLLDLQADLRVALSTPSTTPHPAAPSAPSAAAIAPFIPPYEPPPSPVHSTASLPQLGLVRLPSASSSAFVPPSVSSTGEDNDNNDTNTDHDLYADMPPLGDVSDSDDSEDEFDESEPESDGVDGHTPNHDHNGAPPPPASDAVSASPPETDTQGRINWWRLYRFAPLAVPPGSHVHAHAQGVPAVLGAPGNYNHPTPAAHSSHTPTPHPAPSFDADPDPALAELPFASSSSLPSASPPPPPHPHQHQPNSVVPVIVVGVQSVLAHPPRPTSPLPSSAPSPSPNATSASPDEAHPSTSTSTPTSPPPSTADPSRGWQTRAAETIRSIRPPGRRSGTDETRAPPGPGPAGSRTFLIYVIGGYYPPNHSILNGGPDTLASLEALLELADLLGHAKPTTVTKEDIERSGLETIKSAQLAQYEAEEKISSNCTERCLICLDDYQPEEDIRVMRCRHAFHQNCVDKWLETGRNNCPACRSKVRTL